MKDTLGYAKKLVSAGFTEYQVEASFEVIDDALKNKIATKDDLSQLEFCLRQDMENMELRLNHKFELLESRLTIRMGLMMFTMLSTMKVLEKFI